MGDHGTAWDRLGPLGTTWDDLGPLGTPWDHLDWLYFFFFEQSPTWGLVPLLRKFQVIEKNPGH